MVEWGLSNKKQNMFKKAIIPKISGMSNLDSIVSGEKAYVTVQKPGLYVKFEGSSVFTDNGIELVNKEFLEDFSDVIKKVRVSKMIIFARIYSSIYTEYKQSSMNRLGVLFNQHSPYFGIKDNMIIEVYDLLFQNQNLPFRVRKMTMDSFVKHLETKDPRIRLQRTFTFAEMTEERCLRLAKFCCDYNSKLLIRTDESRHLSGCDDFDQLNMLEFHPFEMMTIQVKSFNGFERKDNGKITYVVNDISINFKGKEYVIDFKGQKQSRVDYVYESKYRNTKLYLDFLVAKKGEEIIKIMLT